MELNLYRLLQTNCQETEVAQAFGYELKERATLGWLCGYFDVGCETFVRALYVQAVTGDPYTFVIRDNLLSYIGAADLESPP